MRYLKSLGIAALIASSVALLTPAAHADILYGTGASGQLFSIDTNNLSSFTTIATFNAATFTPYGGGSTFLNALALDEASNSLYFRNDSGNSGSSLFKYNLTTNTLSKVTNLGFSSFNASFYNGYYWAVQENSNTLVRVDVATGATTTATMGTSGSYSFGDIAINQSTGTVYGSATNTFFKGDIVNPTGTPSVTNFTAFTPRQRMQISFDASESFLYGQDYDTKTWYKISTTDGSTTSTVGTGQFGVTDLAGPRNRVPEPATLALLGIGLGIGAGIRRRA